MEIERMGKDPDLFQVKNTFSTMYRGVELTYIAGEVVHPDDPLLKKLPEHFGPLEFPHDPVAFKEAVKAAAPRPATAAEEKAIAATVEAEAEPVPEPEPTPEPEPEEEPKPRPWGTRTGRRGTIQTPEIRS